MMSYCRQLLLSLLLMFFVSPVFAIDKATQETEIRQLFDDYMVKYNQFIQDDIFNKNIHLYHEQVMLVTNARGQTVVSATQMDKNVMGFLGQLKKKGVASVKWLELDISMLDTQLAIVRNVAVRFTKDDAVFNKVGATYLLQKGTDGWRIAAFSIHPPEFPISS